ncbi:MAG: uridine diphosphate-N-acetylglucosamine-binding protein YvcK [Oscillospiraceae bacterium]
MDNRGHQKVGEPAIVAIGGGTGLSTMLRGLKKYTKNLTAIVTVADDGGGSGVLRSELKMPPPGDIRNCLQALANTEPTMRALMNYRFTEGSLKGQSFGNLFLAALNGMSDSFDQAVMKMSDVLAITGRVLPVSNENIRLLAEFDDGTEVLGESHIAHHKAFHDRNIRRVRLIPEHPAALPASIRAIEEADMIILGPGSLYTSIIPNLLTEGIAEAVCASPAVKVYVMNIMTQDGETEGYTASQHIAALQKHSGRDLFQFCLANSMELPEAVLSRYRLQGAEPTVLDREEIEALGVHLLTAPVADVRDGFVRHHPHMLARELMRIFFEESPTRIYK